MADYERYGDYNDIEEDELGQKRPILRLVKILVSLTLFLFCGFLVFRMLVAEYYPREMRKLTMTPGLTAYSETHDLDPEKLKIRVPYDDNVRASFIADNLVIERQAGAVQFTLRLSRDTMARLSETTGTDVGREPDETFFVVTLYDDLGNRYEKTDEFGRTYLWYRAVKYCFLIFAIFMIAWMFSGGNLVIPFFTFVMAAMASFILWEPVNEPGENAPAQQPPPASFGRDPQ